MKTQTAKQTVRALIRALVNLSNLDSYAMEMDAGFDSGEWSRAWHGPGTCDGEVDTILARLGITRDQATAALEAWGKLDRTPEKPWGAEQPLAHCLMIWLATAEEMEMV